MPPSPVPHQLYRGCEAGTDHWQPIIGPGSIAAGYVALADVALGPTETNLSSNVNTNLSSDCEKLATAGHEVEKSDVELLLPVLATVSSSGDDVDKAHSSVSVSLEECACPGCVQERHPTCVGVDNMYGKHELLCGMPPCTYSTLSRSLPHESPASCKHDWNRELYSHEATHFQNQGRYKCAETNCGHSSKQFRDLKRHYRAMHCTKTPAFPCNAPGCKFVGAKGFHRKDKFASHYKNMHQAQAASMVRRRNILPAPTKDEVSGLGIGPSSQ